MASNPELCLITKLLDLTGFRVSRYNLHDDIGIFLAIEKIDEYVKCPHCGKTTNKLHQNHYHAVRDLPISGKSTYLEVNRRQMKCNSCNKIFSEDIDFVKKKRTFTKRFVNKILQEVVNSDIKNTARNNDVSEQEIETMLKDAKKELIPPKPSELKRLGIDEIAGKKGNKSYHVVLVDLDKHIPVGMIENRKEKNIIEYLKSWGEEVLRGITEFSMDLWKPYKNVAEKLMPNANIVADRFHVMKHINEDIDMARKELKREYAKSKNKKEKNEVMEILSKAKYALLKNKCDLTDTELVDLKMVLSSFEKLKVMHQLKEELRDIYENQKNDWLDGLCQIYQWTSKAKVHFCESCRMIRRWLVEISTYFDNRTSQGLVEGINNKIKLIKRRGFGFRNFQSFCRRILLTWELKTTKLA